MSACGGAVEPSTQSGSTGDSQNGSGGSTGQGSSTSSSKHGTSSTSAAATLCTDTGGTVVQTYCSANPPFAQYTCASGENGAICDPAPGQGPASTPECECPGSQCFDPTSGCIGAVPSSSGQGSSSGGSTTVSTTTSPLVEASAGVACTPSSSSASNQPANPCSAGYIWACDNATAVWIQETIVCYTDSTETTQTTDGCGAGEVLYVDDAAGDPCRAGSGEGSSDTVCPTGTYEFEPGCCYGATDAFCVALPAACEGGLNVGCANSVCLDRCNGNDSGQNAELGVNCSEAADGVVDCLCGKA